MMRLITRTRRMFKSLWQDTSGIMLPYVTVMLVVIIGGSLLAVDGARFMSLQTQMQAAADALALAGARELDGKSTAETRAINAINNLVTNGLLGMGVTAALTHQPPVFYEALPAASNGFTGTVARDAAHAKFVAVTVDPKTVPTVFPVTFLNAAGINSFSAGARAIAGNAGQQICKIPPVFLCNPWEAPGNRDDAAATAALESNLAPGSVGVRTQFKVLNDGQVGPGHFGWLVPPDGCNGANCLRTWISINSPNACFRASGVDLNTGAINGALPGLNVRFDISDGPVVADAAHSPDVNVRKGYVTSGGSGNWCDASPDTGTGNNQRAMAPPEDTSFTNFSTAGSKGNGQWDCATYWSFNHTDPTTRIAYPAPAVRADGSPGVCGNPTTTTLSRYDVYAYEVSQGTNPGGYGDWSRGTAGSGANDNHWTSAPPYNNNKGEIGRPLCAGVGTAQPGRRLLYMAVINCEANRAAITGGATANNIPTAGFVTFFMNEPVPTTGPASSRNLVGEMVGFANLVGGGVGVRPLIFNNVQLYR